MHEILRISLKFFAKDLCSRILHPEKNQSIGFEPANLGLEASMLPPTPTRQKTAEDNKTQSTVPRAAGSKFCR